MRDFSDEELMAYADGVLPEAAAALLREALTRDPKLARRVEAYRHSRALLRDAFAPRADKSVPPRLLALLQTPDAPPARATRRRPRRWAVPLALAASLTLAVGVLLRTGSPIADDPLSVALETRASGEPMKIGAQEFMPTASLRDAQGRWCREYEASNAAGTTRGLACRDNASARWIAQASTAANTSTQPDGQYHTASGSEARPGATLAGARQLTAAEEREALRLHWR